MLNTGRFFEDIRRFLGATLLVTIALNLKPGSTGSVPIKPSGFLGSNAARDALPAPQRIPDSLTRISFSTIGLGAIQQAQVVPFKITRAAEFGWSVAVSGNTAVIGALRDDPDAGNGLFNNAGAAYVFVRSGSSWVQEARLVPKDAQPEDTFGNSVAVDGNTIIVGAVGKDIEDVNGAGAAYVFEREGTIWSQKAKLVASDYEENDGFGSSVAIDGNLIVVGADNKSILGMPGVGAAYVFIRRGGSWAQKGKLTAAEPNVGDFFGASVAVDGNTIVVGATEANPLFNIGSGSAYVFSRIEGQWKQKVQLRAKDGRNGDFFGQSVSIYSDNIIVGAPFHDPRFGFGRITNAGAAYIFAPGKNGYKEQVMLVEENPQVFDHFGNSVGMYGNVVVVGAPGKMRAGYLRSGEAFLFKRSGKNWEAQGRLLPSDPKDDDEFGQAVAIHRDTIVVGATGRDPGQLTQAGEAFLYKLVQMELPETGYPPGLSVVPATGLPNKVFNAMDEIWIEIPSLGVKAPITALERGGIGWDISWLWDQVGYLEGTAFPTWKGNTGLVGHISLPNDLPGPFAKIHTLHWGDQIIIHAWDQRYIYTVHENFRVRPDDLSVLDHEELDWVTLITCMGYDENLGGYEWRTVVRAVLVNVRE